MSEQEEKEKEKEEALSLEPAQTEEKEEAPSVEKKKADKKQWTRLLFTLIASAVALAFFGLSYYFFTFNVAAVIFATLVAVIAFTIVAVYKEWETPFKLSVTAIYVAAVFLVGYFIMHKSGLFNTIHSTEDFVAYINNSGGVAEVVFVLVNFLQVTIVPIPSSITITAGAVLFNGIWKPLYLSVIGILAGSMLAFFLGRVFGVRFANWLVGEKAIAKYKKMTKGRDKIVLFYMFLFPFFPDDFLCILAGMTDYTYLGFFLMQVFCRTAGALTTISVAKGIVSIPLQGWWLLLWGVIIVLVITFFVLTLKYSEKIEELMMKLIDKMTFGYSKKRRMAKEEKEEAAELAATKTEEGILPEGEENDHIEH
ncbi:MAG: TVP38/TMEM64 family protein [Clostridia bacterium]|nr:TVP38/TMEM64 family protein [Clostridia bacterium]